MPLASWVRGASQTAPGVEEAGEYAMARLLAPRSSVHSRQGSVPISAAGLPRHPFAPGRTWQPAIMAPCRPTWTQVMQLSPPQPWQWSKRASDHNMARHAR